MTELWRKETCNIVSLLGNLIKQWLPSTVSLFTHVSYSVNPENSKRLKIEAIISTLVIYDHFVQAIRSFGDEKKFSMNCEFIKLRYSPLQLNVYS